MCLALDDRELQRTARGQWDFPAPVDRMRISETENYRDIYEFCTKRESTRRACLGRELVAEAREQRHSESLACAPSQRDSANSSLSSV